MTTITVKGKKFNVEEVAAKALELANTLTAGTREKEIAATTANPAEAERKMVVARAIYRTMNNLWTPVWERIDETDLAKTIIEANTRRVATLRRGFGK